LMPVRLWKPEPFDDVTDFSHLIRMVRPTETPFSKFQWFRNGVPIVGANNLSYTIGDLDECASLSLVVGAVVRP
jgi:hypothetical protein